MSIELRFKEKQEEILEFSGCIGERGQITMKTFRILQYRRCSEKMNDPVTEWTDVPCVGVDDD